MLRIELLQNIFLISIGEGGMGNEVFGNWNYRKFSDTNFVVGWESGKYSKCVINYWLNSDGDFGPICRSIC